MANEIIRIELFYKTDTNQLYHITIDIRNNSSRFNDQRLKLSYLCIRRMDDLGWLQDKEALSDAFDGFINMLLS